MQFPSMEQQSLIHKDLQNKLHINQNAYINHLLMLLPSNFTDMTSSSTNNYQKIVNAIKKLSYQHKIDSFTQDFFKEIAVDKKEWHTFNTSQAKYDLVMRSIQKNIQDQLKKINQNTSNKNYCSLTNLKGKQNKKDNFQWLKLKHNETQYEAKLKAKLVQAISDDKNEKRIRFKINNPNKGTEKVSLLEESLILDEYEKSKLDYEWTSNDEKQFLQNISSLKSKFNSTDFLKRCQRFKFITKHELQTLASQQISRKLDKSNKLFLSRQFLLDKYYSTTQFLNEQEMRFILKTSPMLSKCVDKQFIKNAIKNIPYQDISKLELKIAEDIIAKFQQVRQTVQRSRKNYTLNQNIQVKHRVLRFQKHQEFAIAREIAREELKKHQVRTINQSSQKQPKPINNEKWKGITKIENKSTMNLRMIAPLNKNHPPSGLFVKDCNEQCNDDIVHFIFIICQFNSYENQYLLTINKPKHDIRNSITMIDFYTGGPEENNVKCSEKCLTSMMSFLKRQFYQKSIKEWLENTSLTTRSKASSFRTQFSALQTETMDVQIRKTKKIIKTIKFVENQGSQIKMKILAHNQETKTNICVSKMLSLAAQNSYFAVKSMNLRLNSQQINTKDKKGNTALLYAAKFNNFQFVNYLLTMNANLSLPCQKNNTPLHFIFKTNDYNFISKCLCSSLTVDLNILNSESKTALAYCNHNTLLRLGLADGVVWVKDKKMQFDNNKLFKGRPEG